MMFKVGDRVTVRFSAYGKGYPTASGTITHRTWENASYVRLDNGQEVIARHENLTRETRLVPEGGA
jgi:translation initiation factor IF-1